MIMSKMTRAETKREFVQSVLSTTGGKGVVVCPVFIEDKPGSGVWTPTDTAVIEDTNPDWCAINVMSVQESYNASGFENQRVMSALIRRKVIGADEKYTPGMVLTGKIAVMEQLTPTDADDDSRDVKYLSADLEDAGIPCTLAGKPIYQRRYYTDNLQQADILIAHDNVEAIANHRAATRAGRTVAGAKK